MASAKVLGALTASSSASASSSSSTSSNASSSSSTGSAASGSTAASSTISPASTSGTSSSATAGIAASSASTASSISSSSKRSDRVTASFTSSSALAPKPPISNRASSPMAKYMRMSPAFFMPLSASRFATRTERSSSSKETSQEAEGTNLRASALALLIRSYSVALMATIRPSTPETSRCKTM